MYTILQKKGSRHHHHQNQQGQQVGRGGACAGPPGRPAGQRPAGGAEDYVAGDGREGPPQGQEPPAVQPDGEVEWHHPHLDQRDQLGATERP